ncbi:MAG: AAA family ATPase [Candidatus Nanoarchaeia archaeon]
MKQTMNLNEKYMKMFGWRENPFNFKILPELLVGYNKQIEKLMNSITNDDKLSLLLGPTGSGKTTVLKYLFKKLNKERKVFYLSKPPRNPHEWVQIFINFIRPSIFGKIFSREKNLNIYNLSEWVNKKMKKNKIVLLVDEVHEASIETLEWLRTLADQIDNLSVIIAGLPILENILKENLETFLRRVNIRVELTSLSKAETRELIKNRIEWAGGEDIKPFTSETVEYIYERTGGFPREVIRMCNELIQNAIEENITTIDTKFMIERGPSFLRSNIKTLSITSSSINDLPSKQKKIIEILWKYGELTPNEIVERMDLNDYKSKDNAIRSVNNILKRLVDDGMIMRKKRGKTYQYLLSEKTRTLMVNA